MTTSPKKKMMPVDARSSIRVEECRERTAFFPNRVHRLLPLILSCFAHRLPCTTALNTDSTELTHTNVVKQVLLKMHKCLLLCTDVDVCISLLNSTIAFSKADSTIQKRGKENRKEGNVEVFESDHYHDARKHLGIGASVSCACARLSAISRRRTAKAAATYVACTYF